MQLNKEIISDNGKLAVAFSGGGDSTALLFWLTQEFKPENITAVHFNHDLRPEADSEQAKLKTFCENLGVSFIADKWGKKPEGNIQQNARNARYKFFQKICSKNNFECIYTGHNQDDVAETMLMRLARGSGLKGLSAMAESTTVEGVNVCRPMMDISRKDIRSYLTKNDVKWLEDPSNENDKFFRVRIRKMKKSLEDIGVQFESIVASSNSLRRSENFIQKMVTIYYSKNIIKDNNIIKCPEIILKEDEELLFRIIDKIIEDLTDRKMPARTNKKQRLIEHLKASNKCYELGGVAFSRNGINIEAKKA